MSLKSAKVKSLKTEPNYKDGNTVNTNFEEGPKTGKRQGLKKITLDNNLLNDCNFRSEEKNNYFNKILQLQRDYF